MSTDVLQILKDYKEYVILAVLFIACLLVNIIRKKPNKVIDTLSGTIQAMLPNFIRTAERKYGDGHGDEKKNFVITLVEEWFNHEGLDFNDYYLKITKMFLENILDTPQKHK